ncbi:hypothetical protein CapIbe_018485 [Capra ibex]
MQGRERAVEDVGDPLQHQSPPQEVTASLLPLRPRAPGLESQTRFQSSDRICEQECSNKPSVNAHSANTDRSCGDGGSV